MDSNNDQEKEEVPETLIEAILMGGERGGAAEHELNNRQPYYHILSMLLRQSMYQHHGTPKLDLTSQQRFQRTSLNGEAWKNLY